MKKLAIIAAVFVAATTMSFAAINGSRHDFADGAMANSANNFGTEICKPCHVPHNPQQLDPPLWSHDMTAGAGYTFYGDGTNTISANNDANEYLDSYSKACMSCHDGTVQLDAHVGSTGSKVMVGTALVGTNLTNDHPIGVSIYSDGHAGNTTLLSKYKVPVANAAKIFTDGTAVGIVSCASCHDPHETSFGKFLRASNANSAICLDCHNL